MAMLNSELERYVYERLIVTTHYNQMEAIYNVRLTMRMSGSGEYIVLAEFDVPRETMAILKEADVNLRESKLVRDKITRSALEYAAVRIAEAAMENS